MYNELIQFGLLESLLLLTTKKSDLHHGHTQGRHGSCDLAGEQSEKKFAEGRFHVMILFS